MTDQELVSKILEGDGLSFRQLVEQYQEMVFRTCMGLLHQQDEADDITQEVFIEVYNSLPRFRFQSKISTWIYRIAVNKSLNHLKKIKRKHLLTRLEDLVSPRSMRIQGSEPATDPTDKSLEDKERSEIIQAALDKLPANQKIAFVLFRYDDLSQKEISEVMQISISAVESLIHRAKQSLQKDLVTYYKNSQ